MGTHKVTVVLTQRVPEEAFVATFPAFPAWVTQGDTLEEALRMAKELVELNLEQDEEGYREMLDIAHALTTVVSTIEVEVPAHRAERHARK